MDTHIDTTTSTADPGSTPDKQITIGVPEDRIAEFYAFYGRFLAGGFGRRRRGPRHGHDHGHGHGHGRHGGGRCAGHGPLAGEWGDTSTPATPRAGDEATA